MKTSRFNVQVDLPERRASILYNSLYGSLTIFEADEINQVTRVLGCPEDIKQADIPIVDVLISQKYLLADEVDEWDLIRYRKLQGIHDENRFDLIIMPTLDCNFSCTYCYESRRQGKMSSEIEEALKNWLTKELPKYKVFLLQWFGGEPLLGQSSIISVTRHATALARVAGVTCVPRITTNGYLLTQERSQELIAAGVTEFQITVDGPPKAHDSLRILRSGKPTFQKIFTNIVRLARLDPAVRIALRVNFNHSNLLSIPELLDLFPGDIRKQLRVVFEPIFGPCELSATDNLSADSISQQLAEYYKFAEAMGYDIIFGHSLLHPGKLIYCYAERANQMIVNYNGDVFKCSVTDFDSSERVGFIDPDGTFKKIHDKWDQWVGPDLFEEQCMSCAFLPLCMGGCKKMRLQNKDTGSFCSLIPTNAAHLLKEIAMGGFQNRLRKEALLED